MYFLLLIFNVLSLFHDATWFTSKLCTFCFSYRILRKVFKVGNISWLLSIFIQLFLIRLYHFGYIGVIGLHCGWFVGFPPQVCFGFPSHFLWWSFLIFTSNFFSPYSKGFHFLTLHRIKPLFFFGLKRLKTTRGLSLPPLRSSELHIQWS